jgi:hypothetical protein
MMQSITALLRSREKRNERREARVVGFLSCPSAIVLRPLFKRSRSSGFTLEMIRKTLSIAETSRIAGQPPRRMLDPAECLEDAFDSLNSGE